jgi:hypothetical protein
VTGLNDGSRGGERVHLLASVMGTLLVVATALVFTAA